MENEADQKFLKLIHLLHTNGLSQVAAVLNMFLCGAKEVQVKQLDWCIKEVWKE